MVNFMITSYHVFSRVKSVDSTLAVSTSRFMTTANCDLSKHASCDPTSSMDCIKFNGDYYTSSLSTFECRKIFLPLINKNLIDRTA